MAFQCGLPPSQALGARGPGVSVTVLVVGVLAWAAGFCFCSLATCQALGDQS